MANTYFNQFKLFKPQGTPEEAEAAGMMLKRQYPELSDEEIGDAFEGAAAITGEGTITPKGVAISNMFESKLKSNEIDPSQFMSNQTGVDIPELAPVKPISNYSTPDSAGVVSETPADTNVGTTVETNVGTTTNTSSLPTRSAAGEALGGLFASLGGNESARTYQAGLAAKDTAAKNAVDTERAQVELSQSKERWEATKAESAMKMKEQADYNNPQSAVSTIAREAVKRMISQDPKFGESISRMDIDNMSATQIVKLMPFVDKVVDNATQQMKLQYQKELNDAKNDYQQKLLDAKMASISMRASSGASRGSSGRSSSDGSRTVEEDGKISGVKQDRQGNRTLDPLVAKELIAKQEGADNASNLMSSIPEIEKTLPDTSQSTIGEALGIAQTFIGMGETGAANKRMEQFANSALATLDSPLMKGAPSEADARRALSIINDPRAPLNVKKDAIALFKKSLQDSINKHKTAMGQYDGETLAKLRGLGVTPSTDTINTPQTKVIGGKTYVKVAGGWEEK